jgi:hypothetical protein
VQVAECIWRDEYRPEPARHEQYHKDEDCASAQASNASRFTHTRNRRYREGSDERNHSHPNRVDPERSKDANAFSNLCEGRSAAARADRAGEEAGR